MDKVYNAAHAMFVSLEIFNSKNINIRARPADLEN